MSDILACIYYTYVMVTENEVEISNAADVSPKSLGHVGGEFKHKTKPCFRSSVSNLGGSCSSCTKNVVIPLTAAHCSQTCLYIALSFIQPLPPPLPISLLLFTSKPLNLFENKLRTTGPFASKHFKVYFQRATFPPIITVQLLTLGTLT